jgi:sugar lactone lactonase YvrE
MKSTLAILFLALTANTLNVSAQKLTLSWTSDTLLRVPESVLFDKKANILYVSNIDGKSDAKDGKGFISRLGTDGKIIDLKWVDGLDAPKGMALVKNLLYVADLSAVAVIDIQTGTLSHRIEIEGAQFLNDVAASPGGDVYVSDSALGRIHLIRDGKAALHFESPELKRVNGLLCLKDGLYVADAGNGIHYKLSGKKQMTKFSETSQGADGIVVTEKGDYIVSSWGGEIFFVSSDGKSTKMLDTKDKKLNSADVDYDVKTRTLYVPTFFGNTVMAYTFSR